MPTNKLAQKISGIQVEYTIGAGAASPMPIYELGASAGAPAAGQKLATSNLWAILFAGSIGLVGYFEVFHLLDLPISFLVLLAIFFAAAVSSIAGFAFSAICGAMLFHLLAAPLDVVEIMLLCSIAIQMLSVLTLKSAIDLKHLTRFVIGGAMGLPVGVYVLTHVSGALYMKGIGIFLILYGCYMLARRPATIRYASSIGDYAAGFLGGITGGSAAFPGAFVTIWCGLKGWPKDRQRGAYQPFILVMQVLALVLIFCVQAPHHAVDQIDLLTIGYIPAALAGTWCGIAIFRRLTDVQFTWSVNLLLVASGLGLVS